jgi:predicted MFS family arabinose efflux permease
LRKEPYNNIEKKEKEMNRFAIYLLALGAFGVGTAEFVVSGILEMISGDLGVSISGLICRFT